MFVPITDKEREEMLKCIGIGSFDEILSQVPESLKSPKFEESPGLTEMELVRHMGNLGEKNRRLISFLGAGAYEHFIPAAVWSLVSRGEFATAYTPYQAEASQGTLQAMYEFQTMICELTGMDVANASLYDGASALAEAVNIALNHTGRKKVLCPRSLHPHYRMTVATYFGTAPPFAPPAPAGSVPQVSLEEIPCPGGTIDFSSLEGKVDSDTACVIVPSPNFFGCIEDVERASRIAHSKKALLVAVFDPVSLAVLNPPGAGGADIAVGEGLGLGNPLSFGGPGLGIFACKSEFLRRVPGRISGMTRDVSGKRGFVLTLQAREQHIRRERASSNICTNEALCALAATVYLSLLGPQGLKEVCGISFGLAHLLASEIGKIPGFALKYKAPFFNEFVVQCPVSAQGIHREILDEGILAGLPLETFYPELKDTLLLCATEVRTKDEVKRLANAFLKWKI